MLIVWIVGAACIVATLYVTLTRVVPIKFVLGYATVVDVMFTIGMISLFHETATGLMSATLAGLILACSLSAGRYLFGYTRFTRSGYKLVPQEFPGKLSGVNSVAKRLAKHLTIAF